MDFDFDFNQIFNSITTHIRTGILVITIHFITI